MKTFIFSFLFIFSISNVIAQDQPDQKLNKFSFGIKHGYTTWDINANYDSYSNIHLSAGLFAERSLTEKLSVRLEVNYSRREIFEIPLVFNYKISNKFEIFGGMELDYAFDDINDITNLQNKSTGFSMVLGTQYNISSHWFVDLRYIHGTTDQFVIGNAINNYRFGKRRSFSFGVGYKF